MNWLHEHLANRTLSQRLADHVTGFVGSWSFLIIHALWFFLWIYFHIEAYPYGLLTMIVSLEAIFLSTLVMISQNTQGDKDRAQADADHCVNRQAKEDIEEVMRRLNTIENQKLDAIILSQRNLTEFITPRFKTKTLIAPKQPRITHRDLAVDKKIMKVFNSGTKTNYTK